MKMKNWIWKFERGVHGELLFMGTRYDISRLVCYNKNVSALSKSKAFRTLFEELKMFIEKKVIRENIDKIANDNIDNDIVFVVAQRGFGKLQLLREIIDERDNSGALITDGKDIKGVKSQVKAAFISAIVKYLVERPAKRKDFIDGLSQYANKTLSLSKRFRFKIKKEHILKLLEDIETEDLKNIYVFLTDNKPLIVLINAIRLKEVDLSYLTRTSPNEGGKITFVLALRPDEEGFGHIRKITQYRNSGIWIFPVMPALQENTEQNLYVAPIIINGMDYYKSYAEFKDSLFDSDDYLHIYELVIDKLSKGIRPYEVFLLAFEELRFEDLDSIRAIMGDIYGKKVGQNSLNSDFTVSHDRKLLWLDALSYYIYINEGIADLLEVTQQFYFDVLLNLEKIYDWENLYSVLNMEELQYNEKFAVGLYSYVSGMAKWTKQFIASNHYRRMEWNDLIDHLNYLYAMNIGYSITNLNMLTMLFGDIPFCSILDIGLKCIASRLQKTPALNEEEYRMISTYIQKAFEESVRWNDILLFDQIVKLFVELKKAGYSLKLSRKDIKQIKLWSDRHRDLLWENGIEKGEFIMPNIKVFISYSWAQTKIVDKLEQELQAYDYEVLRDKNNVEEWDDLEAYMKQIRTADFVIPIVSEEYLHSRNCMFELTELLKDESYKSRMFPCIVKPVEKKKKNEEENKAEKTEEKKPKYLYSVKYRTGITQYWEKEKAELDADIRQMQIQNAVEYANESRVLSRISSDSAQFMDYIVRHPLCLTIGRKRGEYNPSEVAKHFDEAVNKLILK